MHSLVTKGSDFLTTIKKKSSILIPFILTRRLYEKGRGRDYVINLLKMIDWVLVIPEDLELEYKEKLHKLEEEKSMGYVTSFERLSREEGLQQGRHEGFEEGEHHKAIIIAKKMLSKGENHDYIKDITGLSDRDLLSLES